MYMSYMVATNRQICIDYVGFMCVMITMTVSLIAVELPDGPWEKLAFDTTGPLSLPHGAAIMPSPSQTITVSGICLYRGNYLLRNFSVQS